MRSVKSPTFGPNTPKPSQQRGYTLVFVLLLLASVGLWLGNQVRLANIDIRMANQQRNLLQAQAALNYAFACAERVLLAQTVAPWPLDAGPSPGYQIGPARQSPEMPDSPNYSYTFYDVQAWAYLQPLTQAGVAASTSMPGPGAAPHIQTRALYMLQQQRTGFAKVLYRLSWYKEEASP